MTESKHEFDQRRVDELTAALVGQLSEADSTAALIERAHCNQRLSNDVRSVQDYLAALESANTRGDRAHIRSMLSLAHLQKGLREDAMKVQAGVSLPR